MHPTEGGPGPFSSLQLNLMGFLFREVMSKFTPQQGITEEARNILKV